METYTETLKLDLIENDGVWGCKWSRGKIAGQII